MRRIYKGFLCGLIVTMGVSTSTEPRVSVKVSRSVVMHGGDTTVICTVPRAEKNRGLTALIEGYTSSYAQLYGMESRVTYRFPFPRVPCGVGDAVCILETQGEPNERVRTTVLMSGCDPHE